jgi:hypothetical protein
MNGGEDVTEEKMLKTSSNRKGWTGIWRKGRNEGNDKTRPEEKLIVGSTRDSVEWITECMVSNKDRSRNADCDRVARVNGKKNRISVKVVSLELNG